MTNETRVFLKKYALVVLFFFAIAVLLVSLQLFAAPRTEKAIRESAEAVLASWTELPPTVGDRVQPATTGMFYAWTFETMRKGEPGLVFVTPIMGNSGPCSGVFYHTEAKGTRFCGLAGIKEQNNNPEKYGITYRILDSRIRQLERIAVHAGDAK